MSTNDSGRSALKLLASHDEAGNVRTFVFDSAGLKWIAGQSQAYVLPQAGDTESENERWFPIASAPSEGTIHISTRIFAEPSQTDLEPLAARRRDSGARHRR